MWLQLGVRLALIVFTILKSLARFTTRERQHSQRALQNGESALYAMCSAERWMLLMGYPTPLPIATLVAPGPAYDPVAEVLRLKGYGVLRGARGAGGRAALYELTGLVLDGSQAVLAVDGPLGPPGTVYPGIIELARDTQAPIIPLLAACAKPWRFNLPAGPCEFPRPFSRCVILEGEPLRIAEESGEAELEAGAIELAARLHALKRAAQTLALEDEPGLKARSERECR